MSSSLPEKKGDGQIVGRRVEDVRLHLSELNEQRVNEKHEKISAILPVFYIIVPFGSFILRGQLSAILQLVIIITAASTAILWFKRNEFGKQIFWNVDGIGMSKDGFVVNWTPWKQVESIRLSLTKAYIVDRSESKLWAVSITRELKEYFNQTRFHLLEGHAPTISVSEDLIRQEASATRKLKTQITIGAVVVFFVLFAIELSPIHQTPIFEYINLILLLGVASSFTLMIVCPLTRTESEKFLIEKPKTLFDPNEDLTFDLKRNLPVISEMIYKGEFDTKPRTTQLTLISIVVLQSMSIPILVFLFTHRIDTHVAILLFVLCLTIVLLAYIAYVKHSNKIVGYLNRDANHHIAKREDKYFVLTKDKMLEASDAESCNFAFVSVNGSTSYLKLHTDEGVFYFQPHYMRPIFKAE